MKILAQGSQNDDETPLLLWRGIIWFSINNNGASQFWRGSSLTVATPSLNFLARLLFIGTASPDSQLTLNFLARFITLLPLSLLRHVYNVLRFITLLTPKPEMYSLPTHRSTLVAQKTNPLHARTIHSQFGLTGPTRLSTLVA